MGIWTKIILKSRQYNASSPKDIFQDKKLFQQSSIAVLNWHSYSTTKLFHRNAGQDSKLHCLLPNHLALTLHNEWVEQSMKYLQWPKSFLPQQHSCQQRHQTILKTSECFFHCQNWGHPLRTMLWTKCSVQDETTTSLLCTDFYAWHSIPRTSETALEKLAGGFIIDKAEKPLN